MHRAQLCGRVAAAVGWVGGGGGYSNILIVGKLLKQVVRCVLGMGGRGGGQWSSMLSPRQPTDHSTGL